MNVSIRTTGVASIPCPIRWLAAVALWAACSAGMAADAQRDTLRVCADPNNMPFSNQAGEGLENRIAQVFAEDLGATVEYAWYPRQMGFARNTLTEFDEEKGRHLCDLIVGTTSGLEAGQTTEPYYYSTYSVIYRPEGPLQDVTSFREILELPREQLDGLRIGVFSGSPVAGQLLRNGLSEQIVSYKHQSGSADVTPGSIIREDLAGGDLDMMIVWGPIGGYFAAQFGDCAGCEQPELRLLAIAPGPEQPYNFGISMGVRYSDDEWFEQVQALIEDNRDEIDRILREYSVPRVDASGALIGTAAR